MEVIVGWFPFEGGEGIMGLCEEGSDCVGRHVGLLCFRCRMGAVKDCNDGNEGDCLGEGNVRVIAALETRPSP